MNKTTNWIKEDYYCPNCGKQEVWMEENSGDYYVGETYLCINCAFKFALPCSVVITTENDDFNYLDIIKTIKEKLKNED